MASGFSKKISVFIDWFIPSEIKKHQTNYRIARITVAIFLYSSVAYLFSAGNIIYFKEIQKWLSLIAFITPIIALFVYKLYNKRTLAVHIYMFGCAQGILGGSLISGGFEATTALLLIPAVSMLFASRSVAIIWIGITVAFVFAMRYMVDHHIQMPIDYLPEYKLHLQMTNTISMILAMTFIIWVYAKERSLATEALVQEKDKSDKLLLNILPEEIAEELKNTGQSVAKQYNNITVLFTDFVNFTSISEEMNPGELVHEIDEYFKAYDEIIGKHHLEKIKTIGDSYMAVCGLPQENPNHAINTVNAAIDIVKFTENYRTKSGKFDVRVGLNSGSVVAGIVGLRKFAYDVWGDTVNTASRMEQNSEGGKINVSQSTYELCKDHFEFEAPRTVEVKGKGEIPMYFVKI